MGSNTCSFLQTKKVHVNMLNLEHRFTYFFVFDLGLFFGLVSINDFFFLFVYNFSHRRHLSFTQNKLNIFYCTNADLKNNLLFI